MRANDVMRAIELAQQALDAGHANPVLFSLRAHWRKHNGQAMDAIADLESALEMEPRSTKLFTEIADCLNSLGHHRKALMAASDAIDCDPAYPKAWYEKGLAHQMLNELEQSRDAYEHAIGINPRMAGALARLAALAAQQGEHDAARDYAGRALAIRPADDVAQLTLVSLDLAQNQLEPAEARIRSMLDFSGTAALTRAIALSRLGDLRDRQGRRQEAFEAYGESGDRWKTVYGPRYQRPGHESITQMLDRSSATLEALPAVPQREAPRRAEADDSAGLAFIFGFPRTGTTLLGQILASRPDVALFEERPLLKNAIDDFVDARGGLEKLAETPDSALASYREDFWQRVQRQGIETRGKLVVEQTAFNTVYLPVIRRLFPDAPVVFALRDPRDVVFSCFRRLFAPNLFTLELHSLDSTARFYTAVMRFAQSYRDKLDFHPLEVRNEDLVADFDTVTQRLCAHLGLGWDESIRDYQRVTRHKLIATLSAPQVRRGISSDGVAYWENYREQMAPVLSTLAPWVEKFGYSPR
ncbi:MAG TPA: sulfotransferase [Rhizomicrobium sp.]|nr:sulfotransferase [Rhizomicrobium sp.]